MKTPLVLTPALSFSQVRESFQQDFPTGAHLDRMKELLATPIRRKKAASAADILMLQRRVGNRAVRRVLRSQGLTVQRSAKESVPKKAEAVAPVNQDGLRRGHQSRAELLARSSVDQQVIQRTVWEWNDESKRWLVYEPTAKQDEPPYQGKAGDFHDDEGTLGKFDLTREEAVAASKIIKSRASAVHSMDFAMSTSSSKLEDIHQPSETAKPAPEDSLAGLTMVQILKKAFADSGIAKKFQKDRNLFNLLLDVGGQEIQRMGLDAKVTKLPEYYRNALAYTSCHNTANKLLMRMSATPENPGEYTGKDKDAAKSEPNNNWMAAVAAGLGKAIAQDAANSQRAIYEVHCGGHGFVMIVRDKKIEIVQSFANAVSLVERMERGPLIVDAAKIEALTADLAAGSIQERNRAAQFIADCNADVFGLMPDPNSWQYRWRRNALKSDTVILEEFKADLKTAFKDVKGILTL